MQFAGASVSHFRSIAAVKRLTIKKYHLSVTYRHFTIGERISKWLFLLSVTVQHAFDDAGAQPG